MLKRKEQTLSQVASSVHFSSKSSNTFQPLYQPVFQHDGADAVQRETIFTACLGVEGNGPNFPAHIGAYTALLEHNILPIAAIGGSSGAVTASMLMALLQNRSLTCPEIPSELSKPQRAALVLAASDCICNSFVFFPMLTEFWKTVVNWAKNFWVHRYRDRLLADATIGVIHTGNMVGQVALVIDFFRHADFQSVITESSYTKRCQLMKHLWMDYADAIELTVQELLNAIGRFGTEQATEKDGAIAHRFFQLLQPHPASQSLAQGSKSSFRKTIRLFQNYPAARNVFHRLISRSLTQQLLNRPILLPHPEHIRAGAQGFSKSGAFLEIPQGMVIHSTFRAVETACRSRWGKRSALREKPGWEHLYQAYFPSTSLTPYFTSARQRSPRQRLHPPATRQSIVPSERILVLAQNLQEQTRGFSYALQATSSETGYFQRFTLRPTARDRALNPTMPPTILSFGGWLEKTPVSTLAQLPVGQTVHYVISLYRKDSVPWFSRKALRAILGKEFRQQFGAIATSIHQFVSQTETLSGQKDGIAIQFDDEWNNPILNGTENFFEKDVKVGLLSDRKAHLLTGYLEAQRVLQAQGIQRPDAATLPWGRPVPAELIASGKGASREAAQLFWDFLAQRA